MYLRPFKLKIAKDPADAADEPSSAAYAKKQAERIPQKLNIHVFNFFEIPTSEGSTEPLRFF